MMLLPLLLLTLLQGSSGQSCEGRCDDAFDSSFVCQCNDACGNHQDCCDDYLDVCGGGQNSCKGKCGAAYDPNLPCECNDQCSQYGNCCPDYGAECGGSGGDGLSNEDLLELGELLLPLDEANVGGEYVISLQCTTTNGNPS